MLGLKQEKRIQLVSHSDSVTGDFVANLLSQDFIKDLKFLQNASVFE